MARSATCPSCQHALAKGASFCTACGTNIGGTDLVFEPVGGSLANEHDVGFSREVTTGLPSHRRRAVVIGLAATVAMVGAASVVGRSHSPTAAPATSTTTTTPEETTAEQTTSSVPQPDPPRKVLSGRDLLGEHSGLEAWALGYFTGDDVARSGIYRVDFDGGTVQRLADQPSGANGPPPLGMADSRGLTLIGFTPNVRIGRDGSVTTLSFVSDDNNNQFIAVDEGGVWQYKFSEGFPFGTQRIVHRLANGSYVPLQVPDGADFTGFIGGKALLRGGDGSRYWLDPASGSIERLPNGTGDARANGALLYLRCDDTAACAVVHRNAAGEERVVDSPVNEDVTLSPDGSWVVLTRADYSKSPQVLRRTAMNPVTGERVNLGEAPVFDGLGDVVRSPDDRWMIFARADGVAAWRPGLAEPIVIRLGRGDFHPQLLVVGRAP